MTVKNPKSDCSTATTLVDVIRQKNQVVLRKDHNFSSVNVLRNPGSERSEP
jgi:hypothetical protein